MDRVTNTGKDAIVYARVENGSCFNLMLSTIFFINSNKGRMNVWGACPVVDASYFVEDDTISEL